MKQLAKPFFIVIISLYNFYGCSTFAPYKVPVLQGNILEDKNMEQLVKGLTKDQVQYLLGTPLLNSPVHQTRWDYFYSIKIGDITLGEKKLSLQFNDEERLESWIIEEINLAESQ